MPTKAQIAFVRSLAERAARESSGLFVAEGVKLVRDLLESHLVVACLYARAELLPHLGGFESRAGQIVLLSDAELARMSSQRAPQGVLALVELPRDDWRSFDAAPCRSLLLDELQDPGNVGTLVRIADWFGFDAVFASPGSADFFQPKVVQASMGSLARVRLYRAPLEEVLEAQPNSLPRLGAVLDGDDLYQCALPPTGLLLIGNEARGLSPALQRQLSHRLRIPAFAPAQNLEPARGHADSLNAAVAAAVLAAEWCRQRASRG